MLRTNCSRVAFQSSGSAALRVSIDTGLCFTKVCMNDRDLKSGGCVPHLQDGAQCGCSANEGLLEN